MLNSNIFFLNFEDFRFFTVFFDNFTIVAPWFWNNFTFLLDG